MTRDQNAATGQQVYAELGHCECGCLETFHEISKTTKRRAACSNSACGCRRFARFGEPA